MAEVLSVQISELETKKEVAESNNFHNVEQRFQNIDNKTIVRIEKIESKGVIQSPIQNVIQPVIKNVVQ